MNGIRPFLSRIPFQSSLPAGWVKERMPQRPGRSVLRHAESQYVSNPPIPILAKNLTARFLRLALLPGLLALGGLRPAAADGFIVFTHFPDTDGSVTQIVVDAPRNVVYLAGSFTAVGGQPRQRLAAVSLSTGAVLGWNPSAGGIPDGAIYGMAVDPDTGILYVGGDFGTFGGQPRNRLAAVQPSGAVSSWTTGPNITIQGVVVKNSVVYPAGSNTPAYSAATGATLPWLPGADNSVYSVAATDSAVYIGGFFNQVGLTARPKLAAVDLSTGTALPAFNASFDNSPTYVSHIVPHGGLLYVAGSFSSIAGQSRNGLGAVDAATGALAAWAPPQDNNVLSLAATADRIYLGGNFSTVSSASRFCLAAVDSATGAATAWNPGVNSSVAAIATHGSTVFIGGYFTTVDGGTRQGFAAIHDPDLGAPLPAVIDLGTITDTEPGYAVPDLAALVTIAGAGQVAWYKFTLADDADVSTGRFFDIATMPTGSPTTFPGNHTEIGLYREDGTLVASDDDGSVADYSQLSFSQLSPALPVRGPLASPGYPSGAPANGAHGPLPAGTYYVAVAGFDTTFGSTHFAVTTNSAVTGTFRLEFRTGLPASTPPAANRAPTVKITAKSIAPTRKGKVKITGTSADPDGVAPRVFVKVGKAKFRQAKRSGFKWTFSAKLKIGRNAVRVYAIDTGALRSPVRRAVIVRRP